MKTTTNTNEKWRFKNIKFNFENSVKISFFNYIMFFAFHFHKTFIQTYTMDISLLKCLYCGKVHFKNYEWFLQIQMVRMFFLIQYSTSEIVERSMKALSTIWRIKIKNLWELHHVDTIIQFFLCSLINVKIYSKPSVSHQSIFQIYNL